MRLKNKKNDQKFQISTILDQPYLNATKVSPQIKYEKVLYSIYILFLQEQKFCLFHNLEKNEAQNKKHDRNLSISAILDQPYLNTTNVNFLISLNFKGKLFGKCARSQMFVHTGNK